MRSPAVVARYKRNRPEQVGTVGEWATLVAAGHHVLMADGRRFDPMEFPDLYRALGSNRTPSPDPNKRQR